MAGYILHETGSRVVIATMESDNVKTGNMVQIWILNRSIHPVEAVKTGDDAVVCGDCQHRGTSCYVQIGRAPAGVWKAYQRGAYSHLNKRDYKTVFAGRAVRFGAYGDPAFMPIGVIRAIADVADGHTGYTHQWRKASKLRNYVMASCDSPRDMWEAREAGWRTFRVATNTSKLQGEILCPASEEAGKRTTCIDCQLCDGKFDATDRRANIMIPVHGARASQFQILS